MTLRNKINHQIINKITYGEINSNLKELITINKLQFLITIFLYIESNEFQKKILADLTNSNKQQKKLLTELINSNKELREYNKELREYNKTLGETFKETLLYLKDFKNSQNSNNNKN